METRLRLLIVRAGLPRPKVQWVVQDESAHTAFWLDLAYPDQTLGIEYDGTAHTDPDTVLRDIARHTALLDLGWRVYRYTRDDVLLHPTRIIDQLRRALATGPTRRPSPASPPRPNPTTSFPPGPARPAGPIRPGGAGRAGGPARPGGPAGTPQVRQVRYDRSTRREGPGRAQRPG
jgi:hypothetical protein